MQILQGRMEQLIHLLFMLLYVSIPREVYLAKKWWWTCCEDEVEGMQIRARGYLLGEYWVKLMGLILQEFDFPFGGYVSEHDQFCFDLLGSNRNEEITNCNRLR